MVASRERTGDFVEHNLCSLRGLIQDRMANGAELVQLDLPGAEAPWHKIAGIYREDDPLIKEWEAAMAEYRRKVDDDPEYL